MTASRPCPDQELPLLDRAAGSIDGAAAARLEVHLAGCEACRAEAAALESALAAARLPPPSEAELRALDRAQAATLRHWRGAEGSRRNRSLLHGFSAGFAVAAAAAVLVIAPGSYRRAQQGQGSAAAVAGGVAAVPVGARPADETGRIAGDTGSGPVAAAAAAAEPEVASWEPDLDAVWETASLAVGEDPGDEELAWTGAADLYEGDYQ
jgi:hypothetical protein